MSILIHEVKKMELKDPGMKDVLIDIKPLNRLMGNHAFILGEHWDYVRVTYDYKIASKEKNITYYIRIQGYAVEGDVDKKNAVIKLFPPIIGKHYYPTGIEYGEEENFPENLIERANNIVANLQEDIDTYKRK
ncbi:MAG TPA: YugN family protein [Virgibacillus sp.]|nr:YugN family protein [Virgibacillus sp.]